MSQVDPEQRNVRFPDQLGRAEDGSIAAKHHAQVHRVETDVLVQRLAGNGQFPVRFPHGLHFFTAHHGNQPGGMELGAGFLGSRHGVYPSGVREHQYPPAHRSTPGSCPLGSSIWSGAWPDPCGKWAIAASTSPSSTLPVLRSGMPAGTLIHRKYSTFPSCPGRGLAANPRTCRPASRADETTFLTARNRSASEL